jgi:hypothetical protein
MSQRNFNNEYTQSTAVSATTSRNKVKSRDIHSFTPPPQKKQEIAHLYVKYRLISKKSKGTVHSKTGHEVPEEQ